MLEVTRGNNDCDSKGVWMMELYQYCNGSRGDSDDSDGESGNS